MTKKKTTTYTQAMLNRGKPTKRTECRKVTLRSGKIIHWLPEDSNVTLCGRTPPKRGFLVGKWAIAEGEVTCKKCIQNSKE